MPTTTRREGAGQRLNYLIRRRSLGAIIVNVHFYATMKTPYNCGPFRLSAGTRLSRAWGCVCVCCFCIIMIIVCRCSSAHQAHRQTAAHSKPIQTEPVSLVMPGQKTHMQNLYERLAARRAATVAASLCDTKMCLGMGLCVHVSSVWPL